MSKKISKENYKAFIVGLYNPKIELNVKNETLYYLKKEEEIQNSIFDKFEPIDMCKMDILKNTLVEKDIFKCPNCNENKLDIVSASPEYETQAMIACKNCHYVQANYLPFRKNFLAKY